MKRKSFCLLICILFVLGKCVIYANAQVPGVSFSEEVKILQTSIIQKIQENVDFLKENIVNYLSKEEISIDEFALTGKKTKTTNITTEYRVFHSEQNTKTSYDCKFIYDALAESSVQLIGIQREEREVFSVIENNKEKKVKKFYEPFWVKGHSYADLLVLFDKQYEKCFIYNLAGRGKIRDRDAYAIEIKQKNREYGTSGSTSWESFGYDGIAWIDIETNEIVQLSRNMIAVHHYNDDSILEKTNSFTTQYDYEKVQINGKFLTLPVEKTIKYFQQAEVSKGSTSIFRPVTPMYEWKLLTQYVYRYSDYKAFNVDTKINFGVIDE